MSHLWVDVIAHNHFVPAHEHLWWNVPMLTHAVVSDHRDAHLRAHRRQGLAGEFGCIYAAQHAPHMRQTDEGGMTVC